MIQRGNEDKPHRCPACHAVAVWGEPVSFWQVYGCPRCLTCFMRNPWLFPLVYLRRRRVRIGWNEQERIELKGYGPRASEEIIIAAADTIEKKRRKS